MYRQELYNKEEYVEKMLQDYGKIEPIVESPVTNNYRNKINLSFGYYKGKLSIGSLQTDFTVIPASNNNKCSLIAIKICEYLTKWITKNSKLNIFNHINLDGFWRHITIYNSNLYHVMIVFHIQNINRYFEQWNLEFLTLKFNLSKFISDNKYYLNSIYYQNSNTKKETRNYDPYYLIYGNKLYIEVLDNYKFNISPGGFFQVNSYTAEIIYQKVLELSNLDKTKTVLDLCCGTGTFGCFMANNCKEVYGVDYNNTNITDAQINKSMNNITNMYLYYNKVETIIPKLFSDKELENVIAIINPPRKGLNQELCKFIISQKSINHIIYISCNVDSLKRDLETMNIQKDQIKNIIPINQFPNTHHVEIIVNIILN